VVDSAHIGKSFPSFSYTIERGKIGELVTAIGDENPVFRTEVPPIPPTFATAVMNWGGGGLEGALNALGIAISNVLHAEQEYEYLAPLQAGDTLTSTVSVANIYKRGGMEFVEFQTMHTRQDGVVAITERAVIIVREQEAE